MTLAAAGIAPAGVSCRIGLHSPGAVTPDTVTPAIDLMRYRDGGFHQGRFRKIQQFRRLDQGKNHGDDKDEAPGGNCQQNRV